MWGTRQQVRDRQIVYAERAWVLFSGYWEGVMEGYVTGGYGGEKERERGTQRES